MLFVGILRLSPKKINGEGQLNRQIKHIINTQLFCEFHLYNLYKILIVNSNLYDYSVKELLDNGISCYGHSLFINSQTLPNRSFLFRLRWVRFYFLIL